MVAQITPLRKGIALVLLFAVVWITIALHMHSSLTLAHSTMASASASSSSSSGNPNNNLEGAARLAASASRFPEQWSNSPDWGSDTIVVDSNLPAHSTVPGADGKLLHNTLKVPKFFSPPSLTPAGGDEASSQPHPNAFFEDPDDGLLLPTIFVSIASYRDPACPETILDALTRATHPSRLRFGVVQQNDDTVDIPCDQPPSPHPPCSDPSYSSVFSSSSPAYLFCKHRSNIDLFPMDARLAVGPVFARHVSSRLYRGEYYALQVDAHVLFTKGWDEDIIEQFDKTGNDHAVLTTYLTDVTDSISPEGFSRRDTRPIMCNSDYEGEGDTRHLRHGAQPEGHASIVGSPQLQPFWAAGFSFSRGHFVSTVPYDPYLPMVFQGEEINIGIRGWTHGYDFYAPEKSVCFHIYAEFSKKRKKLPLFWDNSALHTGSAKKAMKRLLALIGMSPGAVPGVDYNDTEADKYGVGSVRSAEFFYKLFGIDVVKKTTKRHLCDFVDSGNMHRKFHEQLLKKRSEGGGDVGGALAGPIDYERLDPNFKIPAFLRGGG